MAAEAGENHYDEGWGWAKLDFVYRQYMWVWLGLFILTMVEVFIPEPQIFASLFESIGLAAIPPFSGLVDYLYGLSFPRAFVVVALIGLALTKTWMVAWYYMHLIAEKPSIILVACAPFVFSLFLTIGLFPWETTFGIESLLYVPD